MTAATVELYFSERRSTHLDTLLSQIVSGELGNIKTDKHVIDTGKRCLGVIDFLCGRDTKIYLLLVDRSQ